MHTSLDALPHLMHAKSGNQLVSRVKIIKFKGCMHFLHAENLQTYSEIESGEVVDPHGTLLQVATLIPESLLVKKVLTW